MARWVWGQRTDSGRGRESNQDAILSLVMASDGATLLPYCGLFIVADGMGGKEAGKQAAALTIRVITEKLRDFVLTPLLTSSAVPAIPDAIAAAVRVANAEMLDSEVSYGSAVVTLAFIVGATAYIGHVGDGRAYFIDDDSVEQLTSDHTLAQRLIDLGQLTDEDIKKNPRAPALYRALGQNEALPVDTSERALWENSSLVLCSSGLVRDVDRLEIADIVRAERDPQDACDRLIEMANERSGLSNVSVIIVKLMED